MINIKHADVALLIETTEKLLSALPETTVLGMGWSEDNTALKKEATELLRVLKEII